MTQKFNIDGEPRIRIKDVDSFILFCNEEDIAIIGAEGGRFHGGGFYPDLDMIADFSSIESLNWQKYRIRCNESARSFFDNFKHEEDLVFVMTIINQSDFHRLKSR